MEVEYGKTEDVIQILRGPLLAGSYFFLWLRTPQLQR